MFLNINDSTYRLMETAMTFKKRDFQEKRDFIRMNVNTKADLTLEDGTQLKVTCHDLSSSGLKIESSEAISNNINATICINSGGGETSDLQAEVKICRVEQLSDNKYDVGAEIINYI